MTTYKVADLMQEMKEGKKFGMGRSTTNLVQEIVQIGGLFHVTGDTFEVMGKEDLLLSVTPIPSNICPSCGGGSLMSKCEVCHMTGTIYNPAPCDVCGSTNICCADETQGLCSLHCACLHIRKIWDGKWAGGGSFERGE